MGVERKNIIHLFSLKNKQKEGIQNAPPLKQYNLKDSSARCVAVSFLLLRISSAHVSVHAHHSHSYIQTFSFRRVVLR
jgi:hypothetical protein